MHESWIISAKKRGYDIVVEWVPTQATAQQSKAERELKNDPFSTFFSGLSESGQLAVSDYYEMQSFGSVSFGRIRIHFRKRWSGSGW